MKSSKTLIRKLHKNSEESLRIINEIREKISNVGGMVSSSTNWNLVGNQLVRNQSISLHILGSVLNSINLDKIKKALGASSYTIDPYVRGASGSSSGSSFLYQIVIFHFDFLPKNEDEI